jgi:TPR repeat protein
MTPEDRERATRLLKKGDEQMEEGNVASARLFYERAAESGLAQAAMALATTFDAAELSRHKVRGLQPDAKQARRWYERARELGSAEADQRLRRLGAK